VKVSPADVSNWPVNKASLVSLPLNTKGVQQALEKVMGELGRLGTAFGTWLDAQHLTAAAAVVTVVTIGGGTAVYLRRRGGKHAQKREEEEASSSWLFAHLQSAPDVS
jgi:beta-lactamase superfamily II metal-dependent hydrolase